MSENCVFSPSGQFWTFFGRFFRHFSDILSTFPFSRLSNGLPVTKGGHATTRFLEGFLEGSRTGWGRRASAQKTSTGTAFIHARNTPQGPMNLTDAKSSGEMGAKSR